MSDTDPSCTLPGEFARSLLHPKTLARRYVGTTDSDSHVLAKCGEDNGSGYGGWEQYDDADILNEQPLRETPHDGRRAGHMTYQVISGAGDTTATYVTDYTGSDPSFRQAHSQMAMWAFCDALGLNVPRHHWLPDEQLVIVEEVGGSEEPTQDPLSVVPEAANRIDAGELLEYISVLLLAGTADLLPKNFKIGAEGQIHVFDFDKLDHTFGSEGALRLACGKAMRTIRALDCVRDEPLEIDKDRICNRVREIATAINTSHHRDRILDTVQTYDELFEDYDDECFSREISGNIEVLSR